MAELTGARGENEPDMTALPRVQVHGDWGRWHIELFEVLKRVYYARPAWDFDYYPSDGTFQILQDSETIGDVNLRYSRRSYKIHVESPYIRKERGEVNTKKLRSVASVEKCILEYCKPRYHQDVVSKFSGGYSFRTEWERSNLQMTQKVKGIIQANADVFIDFCVNGGKHSPALDDLILQVQENKSECDYIRSRQSGAAFFVWHRKSGWWVYAQSDGNVQDVRTYKEFDEIPPEISAKLSILTMLDKDKENHFEPGVGKKNDADRYWVII